MSSGVPPLRPYQARAVNDVTQRWQRALVATLIAPTRTGKTLMAMTAALMRGGRLVVVTPRAEIMRQWAAQAVAMGKTASLVGDGQCDFSGEVVCGTIASMVRHIDAIVATGGFGVLIFDEAHRAMSNSGQYIFDTFTRTQRNGKVLLTTATPGRSDEWLLEFLMDSPPVIVTHDEAVRAGALLNGRVVEVSGADNLDDARAVRKLLDVWQSEARRINTPTLFFVDRVRQIEAVVAEARRRGVSVAGIDGKTPKRQRRAIIADYRAGRITMLVNVQVLTEGLDANMTEVVVLGSQPNTTTPYVQRIGRALGAYEGKETPVVIVNNPHQEARTKHTPVFDDDEIERGSSRGLWRPWQVMERVERDRAAGKDETKIWF